MRCKVRYKVIWQDDIPGHIHIVESRFLSGWLIQDTLLSAQAMVLGIVHCPLRSSLEVTVQRLQNRQHELHAAAKASILPPVRFTQDQTPCDIGFTEKKKLTEIPNNKLVVYSARSLRLPSDAP